MGLERPEGLLRRSKEWILRRSSAMRWKISSLMQGARSVVHRSPPYEVNTVLSNTVNGSYHMEVKTRMPFSPNNSTTCSRTEVGTVSSSSSERSLASPTL